MADESFDLVVLGTGGAGHQVAMAGISAGLRVAAIDKGPFGGTCSTRGCIPKKVLAHAAQIAAELEHLKQLGVITEDVNYSWQKLIEFKRSFTDPVSENTQQSLADAGVEVIHGQPSFISENELSVNDRVLRAERFHIATGAEPFQLPIDGAEQLLTSDDFLELEQLPESMVFVGGGYISFEFAHIAARFGVKVTILESSDRPLRQFDPDVIEALVAASQEAGIEIITNFKATAVKCTNNSYKVTDGKRSVSAELAIHGAGRVPVVSSLNLEAANVAYDSRRGIEVDQHLVSTSNPKVTAAGDVADSGPPLTPVAGLEGAVVAANLDGAEQSTPDYSAVVSVIFTYPRVGAVGLSQAEANDQGRDVEISSGNYDGWFDSTKSGIKHAFYKLLVDPNTKVLLGAQVIGPHAAEVANMFGIAISHELTVDDIKQPILAFPTSLDDARSMLP